MYLPDDFEKMSLELMDEYKSEETVKLRRNIDAMSFIIVGSNFIGLKITDIRVWGASMANVQPLMLKVLMSILLVYWMCLFAAYLFKDHKYNKERRYILDNKINNMKEYREVALENLKDTSLGIDAKRVNQGRVNKIKPEYEVYVKQIERTTQVRFSTIALKYLTSGIPFLLGFMAIMVLAFS